MSVRARIGPPGRAFRDTMGRLAPLHLAPAMELAPALRAGGIWIDQDALARPSEGPLAGLMALFATRGFAPNRKAAAASLLLRLGWASGFAMAAYIALRRVPVVPSYALFFNGSTMLTAVRADAAVVLGLAEDPFAGAEDWGGTHAPDALRLALIRSLADAAEPIVEACHAWSRFSRHALWSMIASSWSAQFFGLAEVHGVPDSGLEELRTLLSLDDRTAGAAPELYLVAADGSTGACQTRAACCLYYKAEQRHFCASCPILPEAERLARNREWIARRAQPV